MPLRPLDRRPPILLLVLLLALPATTAQAAPVAGEEHISVPAPAPGALRPVPGEVLRPFDPPTHAYGAGHRGVDLAATPGDPVHAALAGTVAYAGLVAGTGWVTVDHGGGLVTTYGPVEGRLPAASDVERGAVIGMIAPDGTHLDWGTRLDGAYIDPLSLLAVWRMHLTAAP